MTNEDLIRILREYKSGGGDGQTHFGPHSFDLTDETVEHIIAVLERDRWISASTPPDTERNVFICYGNPDFKAPCIGHYDHTMKRFYEDKNWFASPIYDAMYWCEMPRLPLPEPPKEET